MNDRPIFVVGYQRSGTTLLQALLGAHLRIAAPPELHFMFRIALLANRYGDLVDDANLRRAVHDALNPSVDVLADSVFDENRVFARAQRGQRTMRGVLDAIMREFAERHGKPRWSEKSPGQRIAQIEPHFPEAQFLHIVRDPRDVIASTLSMPWNVRGPHELALRWKDFTLDNIRRGAAIGPEGFLQVRYEDLAREPAAVLRIIFAFLGEEYDPAVLEEPARRSATVADAARPWQSRVLEPVTANESNRRTRLSRRDRLLIDGVVATELRLLGYVPPTQLVSLAGYTLGLPLLARRALVNWRRARTLRDPANFERAIDEYLADQRRLIAHGDSVDTATG